MIRTVKVGVIGCGMISGKYLANCTGRFRHTLEVVAVADLMPELAQQRAREYGIPQVLSVDELLDHPDIEIVVNLTAPAAHVPLNLRALENGKHVYTEKPFALSRAEAEQVLSLAESRGLLVGSAPDTILGAGLQTCRKLIDDGWIGRPYAASGSIIMGHAAAGTHPNFQNFLRLGGDPVLDMGPYYLSALVMLLGPVARVAASARQLHREVRVTNPDSPRYGETVPVEAPTNVAAVLDFHSGAVATLQAAKESFGYAPRLEVFGTEGNLLVPDPNFFGGAVLVQFANGERREVPHTHGLAEEGRGVGIADLAYAIRTGRPHRASGRLAQHVLDVSLAMFESSAQQRHVGIGTRVERPAPLPLGLKHDLLDGQVAATDGA